MSGSRYVGLFNSRHGRTGTLWEGRYKACLVDSEHYVLACYRYIELNPVRARMIDDPVGYRWSSCAANLGHRPHSRLTPHPAWLALGATDACRTAAYQCLLDEAVPEDTLAEIRFCLQQQRAWGRDDFQAMVEAKIRRFAGTRAAHRPRKAPHPISEPDPVFLTPFSEVRGESTISKKRTLTPVFTQAMD